MMGKERNDSLKLFYPSVNLEQRIRPDHILKKIDKYINFNFIYNEVKDKYGDKGNVSVPPPKILKMMLILILYNVRSERELMDTIPERLDWLWFLGYDLDSEIPHHSVLSKARKRWGEKVFKSFFKRIVVQCVSKGLIDGKKIFMDSSLVQANASNNSVIKKDVLDRKYKELTSRMKDQNDDNNDEDDNEPSPVNKKHISTTDPDASIVRKGKGSQRLHYQIHRSVDEKREIITATDVTPGSINEAHRLSYLSNQHKENTGKKLKTIVADKKYGTIENYLYCHDNKLNPHFNPMDAGRYQQKEIFGPEKFKYKPKQDLYICPSGQEMKKRAYHKTRKTFDYKAGKKICENCTLKTQCTRSKSGRSINRHIRQDALDEMYKKMCKRKSLEDIKTRQHLMERSFANGVRFGFKKARWRLLWRVEIQEYLTSTVQNIKKLVGVLEENFLILFISFKYRYKKYYLLKFGLNFQ